MASETQNKPKLETKFCKRTEFIGICRFWFLGDF